MGYYGYVQQCFATGHFQRVLTMNTALIFQLFKGNESRSVIFKINNIWKIFLKILRRR